MVNKKKLVCKINKELEKINDLDVLIEINDYIRNQRPTPLEYYIDRHYQHDDAVKKALEFEVRQIWLDINNKFEPNSEYIDHFCELYVQGHELDIWIHEHGSLFNPCDLAQIIFKLWCKEIVWR